MELRPEEITKIIRKDQDTLRAAGGVDRGDAAGRGGL